MKCNTEALKVLVFILCCVHTIGAVGDIRRPRKLCTAMRAAPTESDIESVLYQVCAEVGGTIYYCPGDTICCTPGSPTSKCCPEDHPLCIEGEYCCAEGYPKVCGDYCCNSDSYCCNDENCCESEDQCCGTDQCCQEQSPCCTGPDEQICCNNETMACCGSQYGCVAPCECPFDAIGCNLALESMQEGMKARPEYIEGPPQVDCPSPLTAIAMYRILRKDESCTEGLIAKDPSKNLEVISHVNCGGRDYYKSQYISFTTSLEVANYYRNKFDPTLQIAIIDIENIPYQCQPFDLTSEEERDEYLGNAVCKKYAKASCEVLLSCGITRVPCTISGKEYATRDASEL